VITSGEGLRLPRPGARARAPLSGRARRAGIGAAVTHAAGTPARGTRCRAHPFGTGLYGFATKPRMRVLAHSGNDPLRGGAHRPADSAIGAGRTRLSACGGLVFQGAQRDLCCARGERYAASGGDCEGFGMRCARQRGAQGATGRGHGVAPHTPQGRWRGAQGQAGEDASHGSSPCAPSRRRTCRRARSGVLPSRR
jgi:hypothetical protein